MSQAQLGLVKDKQGEGAIAPCTIVHATAVRALTPAVALHTNVQRSSTRIGVGLERESGVVAGEGQVLDPKEKPHNVEKHDTHTHTHTHTNKQTNTSTTEHACR